jgi:hypothetical protein
MNGPSPPLSRLTVFQQTLELGYEHLMFISWPHRIEKSGVRLVQALKSSIEDRLLSEGIIRAGNGLAHPVFLDMPSLDASMKWESRIRHALCRSAATLVLVLPTYFQTPNCALEWGITDALQARRLGSHSETCFLLLPFLDNPRESKEHDFLPPAVQQLNFLKKFDRKKLLYGGKLAGRAWDVFIEEIVGEMRKIAHRLVTRGSPDWAADQQVALAATPFNWYPPEGGPAADGGSQPPSAAAAVITPFPTFTVEGKAA